MLPLRIFLGATFVYAAVQKISDPGFLTPGARGYIGSQLHAAAATSPIGGLVERILVPLGPLTGAAVIATELVIGVLVLTGILTRWAAVVGALLSITLFLTVTWTVQPYFLGSDTIYAVAWITLALLGDHGVWSLDSDVRQLVVGAAAWRRPAPPSEADLSRRRLLLGAGAAAVALIWVAALLPRSKLSRVVAQATASPSPGGSGAPGEDVSPAPGGAPTAAPTTAPANSGAIGTLSQLRSNGGSLDYTDPKTGDPAVAVEVSTGKVVAFDALCTHQGCTVAYNSADKLLECPCHGAAFDPAQGAQVVGGPAPTPLSPLTVTVAADGSILAAT